MSKRYIKREHISLFENLHLGGQKFEKRLKLSLILEFAPINPTQLQIDVPLRYLDQE